MWRRWFDRLQPLFLLLAIVFIAVLLRSQWETLRSYEWRLHAGWLTLSAGLMVASWLLEVYIWVLLIRLLGSHLPYGAAWRVWFLTVLVRYIPGNVWQPLSMTFYCQQRQIRPEVTLASLVLFQAVMMLAVAPIAAFYFWVTGNWGFLTELIGGLANWLIWLALLPVLLFFLKPDWLLAFLNWSLRKIGRVAITASFTTGRLLLLMLMSIVDWVLWGACFATLPLALGPLPELSLLFDLIAVYPIGNAIGLLSAITPSGIGVREGALYLLLAPIVGGGLITVAALAMRLWNIVGEVVMALICFLLERRQPLLAMVSPTSSAPLSPVEPTLERPR
jgi:glycosyltransferase 2 family protein